MLALAAASAALLLAGCSSGESSDAAAAPTTTAAVAQATTTVAPAPAPVSLYEVTEAGLTTAVHAPVTQSAAELAQGCTEAKQAMGMLGLTEPEQMLAIMQATQEDVSAGTVTDAGEDSWANSTPSEQAALIAAVHAATDGEC